MDDFERVFDNSDGQQFLTVVPVNKMGELIQLATDINYKKLLPTASLRKKLI